MKIFNKKYIALYLAAACLAALVSFGIVEPTLAAGSIDGSISNAGINKSKGTASLFKDLKEVVYLVMGIGGVWSVVWVVIGGMLLSGAGSNPQKRSAGMGAILCACVGLFVIYKAYDIASWAVGLG
ncbi:hypothetical protein [Viridibacillus arvi]|uniref:hypothetical protein n=1 Tax=Viridibacillus arvi TaxID=263475 RepID=UPI003D2A367B